MPNFNRCIHAGNLVNSPDGKFLESGKYVCEFTLAINSKYKSGEEWKEEVSYLDFVAWGKTGEIIVEHVGKGQCVLVESRSKQERWEKDGKKKSRVRFHVDNVQFLSPKKEAAATQATSATQDDVPDDDIPF